MVKTVKLDRGSEELVSSSVLEALADYGGFSSEEIIPGLVRAIYLLSQEFPTPGVVLDEAVDLLSNEEYE